ncbi:hypothetical protein ACIP9G_09305 [Lysinibacillus sp. NPDC093197]|uniref:hypothetical protein n=1 Tax=Lysinibacillus sp. NPDC093197 TaxID=3364132 RepID=UPI0038308E85
MKFIILNKKTKHLFWGFMLFLVLGLISINLADSAKLNYRDARNNFISEFNGKNLSDNDIKNIEHTLEAINERFHTSESIAIFDKKGGIHDVQYLNLDFKEAKHVFPFNADNKENLLTTFFYVTEGFKAVEYYIVNRYFPDWFYAFPIVFFTVSAALFVLWTVCQLKYIYKTKRFKFRLKHN